MILDVVYACKQPEAPKADAQIQNTCVVYIYIKKNKPIKLYILNMYVMYMYISAHITWLGDIVTSYTGQ